MKARVVGCDALARIDEVVNRDAHDAHVLDPYGLLRLYDVNVSQGLVHALGRGHLERMTIYIIEVVAIVLVPNRRTDFIAVQNDWVRTFVLKQMTDELHTPESMSDRLHNITSP